MNFSLFLIIPFSYQVFPPHPAQYFSLLRMEVSPDFVYLCSGLQLWTIKPHAVLVRALERKKKEVRRELYALSGPLGLGSSPVLAIEQLV
jgi:hypothetical protein